jgi:hypothetical protein
MSLALLVAFYSLYPLLCKGRNELATIKQRSRTGKPAATRTKEWRNNGNSNAGGSMAKSLSARIAERIARKKPAGNVRNRAAFLALRGEVKQAIDDGWPVKTIWETLHDEERVAFSYQAFRGYVNRLILSPPANGEVAPASVVADQSRQAASRLAPQSAWAPAEWKPEKPTATGFTFNRTPKKEDLL